MTLMIELSDEEAATLAEVLELDLEGTDVALQETSGDRNIGSAELLTEVTGDLFERKATLTAIRERLRHE